MGKRSRLALAGVALLGGLSLTACSNNLPQATLPASGITASNGGGMRQTGAIPDVSVSNGVATQTMSPRNPRVPTY